MNRSRSADERAAPGDARLQRALRRAPLAVEPEALAALNERVLTQWREQHRAGEARPQRSGAALRLVGFADRRLWIGGAGLLAATVITLGLWLHRSDPTLEELLQPDVLSQMAAGEM